MAPPDQRGTSKEAKRIDRIGFRLAGLGGEFTSNVIAGLLIGWGIDWLFDVRPWGIVGGACAGVAVGMLQFIRQAAALNREMGPVTPPAGGFRPVDDQGPAPGDTDDQGEGAARRPGRPEGGA